MSKETDLIEAIKRRCPANDSIILGIDDDAAVLRPNENNSLVCSDMLMEGTHFLLETASPEAIGHKALGVNLSDIAAMGGKAQSAYISLAIPRRLSTGDFVDRLYEGMTRLAALHNTAIAGGDTNIWDGPFVINVTVVGETHGKGAILRSGAKAGDLIFVTGELGGSIEGHHLNFQPRLKEAKQLMDEFDLHSMMDVSDGLAKDLREIAKQSNVRIELDKDNIPLRENIKQDPNALKRALTDGEDFELCFTLAKADAERLMAAKDFSHCRKIGEVKEGSGLYWSTGEAISWQGYEHGAGL